MNLLDKPVRLGIIGLGHIGKYHIQAIQHFKELQLIAICDRRQEFQKLAPTGVDFYADYQQMLRDSDIETVVIATPNHTHYLIARHVLDSGKHLILEKPAAESMAELEQLDITAQKTGLSIYYAFHAAQAFDVEWFVQYYQIQENRSELRGITGLAARFYDPYVKQGLLLPEAEGLQDCWLDSGINAISVIQRLISLDQISIDNVSAAINHGSKPRFLQCQVQFQFPVSDSINYKTERAGLGIIDTNWTTGRNHKSTVLTFGKSGYRITINHSTQKVYKYNPCGRTEVLADLSNGKTRFLNHYLGVFQNYLDHKKSNTMNNRIAKSAHCFLFKAEEAINRVL